MDQILVENIEKTKLTTSSGNNIFNTLLFVAVFSFITWYVQYHWKRRNLYVAASKINGPLPLPLIGNALLLAGTNSEVLDNLMQLSKTYKSPARLWLGQKLYTVIWNPEQLEIVLNKALEKDEMYKQFEVVVGKGLFTAAVPKWRRHRKIILPTFNQKILDSFVEIFSEKSEILVEQFRKVAGKGTVDIFGLISRAVLDIFCDTALGATVHVQTTDNTYYKSLQIAMETAFTKVVVIWYRFDFIFNATSLGKQFNKAAKEVLAFSSSIVKQKRLAYREKMKRSKGEVGELTAEESQKKKKNTFLDQLIEVSEKEGAKFTDEELREEVDTFMVAGSETTSSVEGFFFLMIGMFSDVQEKIYEEVMDVLGPDRPVEPTDLKEFVYLERVIKETMRILPAGPFLVRAVTEDIKLENCTLPTGSGIILGILALHRDPEIWPDPLKFDPDRFLPEEVAKRHPYSYLPFNGGMRHCVGSKYAMMSMKTLTATVIRKYRFSTPYKSVEEIKLRDDTTLKPVDGFKVSVELRT